MGHIETLSSISLHHIKSKDIPSLSPLQFMKRYGLVEVIYSKDLIGNALGRGKPLSSWSS